MSDRKLKLFQINAVPYGSTAKIMLGISKVAEKNGFESYMYSGYSSHPLNEFEGTSFIMGSKLSKAVHIVLGRLTGYIGCFSYFETKKLIKKLNEINPDIIHLHIMHAWYINLPMLFNYIKMKNIKTVWTFHDCWAFTGHCPYFDAVKCEKWKSQCGDCIQHNKYPNSFFDRSEKMFYLKKKWFTGLKNLTIITPSNWLAGLVKESFLRDYPVKVINNGIDLEIFKPTESDFREKYNLQDKFIILGVAFGWDQRKGMDVFVNLSKKLTNSFQIILVGTNENIDKSLPENIISIHRTQNQKELAEIYSSANILLNPTREDNYPTVNMEALACGTPIITFNTGGSPEIIDDTCGIVVKDDIEMLLAEIKMLYAERKLLSENCLKRAKNFDMQTKFNEYVNEYKRED